MSKETLKTKHKELDLTKVSSKKLEDELNRRAKIERQKAHEETMIKMHELYKKRNYCPILHHAYLPSSYHISYWDGLDVLKKFTVAKMYLGDSQNRHSEVSIYISEPAYKVVRTIVDDHDSKIRKFWEETKEKFEDMIVSLLVDPARIAMMIAETCNDFSINVNDSTPKEIKYYNKIVDMFNDAVIERFTEYKDDSLVDALERIKTRHVNFAFSGSQYNAEDILMAVLKERGHDYKLHREIRAEEDAEWDDEVDDADEEDL